MRNLDVANRVEITSTAITTSKAGAIVGSYHVAGTTPAALNINGLKMYHLAAQNVFTFDIDGIASGSTINVSINPSGGDYHIYFVPYLD